MSKNKKTIQLAVLVAAASLAFGVVSMGDFLKGGKVALATNNKSLVFCDGTASAVPFTSTANVGQVHGVDHAHLSREQSRLGQNLFRRVLEHGQFFEEHHLQ